jgi:hypothetical protein
VLIEKARLEIGLGLGHALETRPIRVSIVVAVLGLALLMGAGVAAESGQPPVPGAGPVAGSIHGPLRGVKDSVSTTSAAGNGAPGQVKKTKH